MKLRTPRSHGAWPRGTASLDQTELPRVATRTTGPSPVARRTRPGITLLEVVISLAILLFSSAAIFSLVQMGSDRAVDVQYHARAAMLCQSKLEELKIGSEPLTSVDSIPFKEKEASAYQYSIDVNDGDMAGIKEVKVTVKRERADGRVIEVSLNQMILDPTIRGSTFDRFNASSGSTTPSGGTSP